MCAEIVKLAQAIFQQEVVDQVTAGTTKDFARRGNGRIRARRLSRQSRVWDLAGRALVGMPSDHERT